MRATGLIAATLALVVALLVGFGAPTAVPPEDVQSSVQVANAAVEEVQRLPIYDPDTDQDHLRKPARWCARARSTEPLLREAARMAAGDDEHFSLIRQMNNLPQTPASAVRVVTDEATCEAAARAYDRAEYRGYFRDEHSALMPVLAVKVGTAYLVDDLRDRSMGWAVIPFDRDWNELMGSYGGGH